jgi:tetratricopeptide (TPR) repeat protein
MSSDAKHLLGIKAFQENRLAEAADLLWSALTAEETPEKWNDWATICVALGQLREAEDGYRRALNLDRGYAQAACNLGVLLAGQNRIAEAIPFLDATVISIDPEQRPRLQALLDECSRSTRSYPGFGRNKKGPAKQAHKCSAPQTSTLTARNAAQPERPRHIRYMQPRNLEASFILPASDIPGITVKCLQAITRQTISPRLFEVIIVGSSLSEEWDSAGNIPDLACGVDYVRDQTSTIGALHRLAVDKARGKLVLLLSYDTVAAPDLLSTHLQAHHKYANEKYAVLGNFAYPPGVESHALAYYLSRRPFLHPQVAIKEGFYADHSYYVSGNLSITREAILRVGSFDARFPVKDDRELGYRLSQAGYRLYFQPRASAWHGVLSFSTEDLIHHALACGEAESLFLAEHPRVLGNGLGPFGRLDREWLLKTQNWLERSANVVEESIVALRQFENLDFRPLLTTWEGGQTLADKVMALFDQAVPNVHWFFLLRKFLAVYFGNVRILPQADNELADRMQVATEI